MKNWRVRRSTNWMTTQSNWMMFQSSWLTRKNRMMIR
jgi:hypothetical protein